MAAHINPYQHVTFLMTSDTGAPEGGFPTPMHFCSVDFQKEVGALALSYSLHSDTFLCLKLSGAKYEMCF